MISKVNGVSTYDVVGSHTCWDDHFWAKGYRVDTVGVWGITRKYVKYQETQELSQQEIHFRKQMKTGTTHRPAFSEGWFYAPPC